MKILSEESKQAAIKRLSDFGFKLSFGKFVDEIDNFASSSVESRVADLKDAFRDKEVDAILTVIGGYNSNQLLRYIDYEIIKDNPKILCGFSDITALGNAIYSKTGLVTYMGPHFSSWAMKYGFEYSLDCFVKCCMQEEEYDLLPSENWSDDPWYIDQENRDFIENEGYWLLNGGEACGRIVGGHVRCLNSLQGTEYWPRLDDSILLLEEDEEINPELFDRQLQSLIHQSDFSGVKGILIGKFQKKTKMTKLLLEEIVKTKKELKDIPIIGNVGFGHTTPLATMSIGGTLEMKVNSNVIKIKIMKH
jgi:muramoyltetrapeptide carboxypeptidase LdcA involved in peptidoglycan recycling